MILIHDQSPQFRVLSEAGCQELHQATLECLKQVGVEAAFQVLLSSLSGAPLVHDLGFLDCADIGSLPYLVLVDEMIGMAKRILRGIAVNADTIMLDLIEKVGPGGMYLTEARSSSLCRSEVWVPTVLERSSYALWEKKGRPSPEEMVKEKLGRILKAHTPTPLQGGVQVKIAEVLEQAEAREKRS